MIGEELCIEIRLGPNWVAGKPSQLALTITKGNRCFIRIEPETTVHPWYLFLALLAPGWAVFMGSDFPLIVVKEEKALKDLLDMNVSTLLVDWPF